MIPVNQEIIHDPENGIYGDCMRACIASLLELPISEIPHFLHDNCKHDIFQKRIGDFLFSKGYSLLCLDEFEVQNFHFYYQEGIHHIISGYTERGTYHAVIGLDGKVIHDPHPSKLGLLPGEEQERIFDFLIKI